MARKKKPAAAGQLPGLQEVKLLWKKVQPRDWLTLFQEIAPDRKWVMAGHTQVKGLCPYHDDHSPSLHVSFHKGMAKCFSCGKFVVDIVSLVAKLKSCSYTEALLYLHMRFGLGDIVGANAEELNKYNTLQETKKMAAIAMNSVLQEVLRDNPEHLAYCRPALHYLRDVRQIPLEVVNTLPVGVFAKPEHAKKYISPNLHHEFDEYFKAYQSQAYWGALCFHYNDSPGTISRFRLRLLDREALPDAKAMATCGGLDLVQKQAMFQKPYVVVDDPYTQDLGVFGLHHYQTLVGNNDTNAYITEGEFDVLSTMAAQEKAGTIDFMIFGTGGNGSTNLSVLREYGVLTAWLVQDHPVKNGDTWALAVLGTKANFTSIGSQEPLGIRVFQWPAGLQGQDLDEAVRLNGYKVVADFIYRQRNSYFQNAFPWILSKCDEEVADIKRRFADRESELDRLADTYTTEISNLENDKAGAITAALLKWFGFVHDPIDKVSFTQRYSVAEKIDISANTAVANSMYALDTMEGVVKKVSDALQEYFSLAYYTDSGKEPAVYGWAKRKEELVEIYTHERGMFKQIGICIGEEATQWFDRLLGENPVYIAGTGKDPATDSNIKRKRIQDIMQKAIEGMLGSLNNINDLKTLAQGIHFKDLPDEARRKNYVYFVNGKKIFRGQYTQDDQLRWTCINNAVDEGVLFTNLKKSAQWSFVEDTADLYAATQVDLRKTYENIRTVLNGWRFQHHDTMVEYLAAYAMSLPVMRAVDEVNITLVTGEAESGKTSLAYGLFGGVRNNGHTITPLLEAGTFSTDASAASVYQSMVGSSLLYVLDEAEDQQAGKPMTSSDMHTQELYRLIYNLPMGGAHINRGSSGGQPVNYHLRMPLLMAAINIPTDPTLLSRVVVINTVKEAGRRNLDLYIQDHFTSEELQQLQRNITVGLLPHIPDLVVRRRRLREQLPKYCGKTVHVSNRFLESVLTPLAVYDLVGGDACALYKDILIRYKDRLEAIHGQGNKNKLLDECLYTPAIKTTTDANVQDLLPSIHLLIHKNYNLLNNNSCGIYYLPNRKWIIFVWLQIQFQLLKNNNDTRRYVVSTFREMASKCSCVVPEVTADEHAEIVNTLGLLDVKSPMDYTVVRDAYVFGNSELPIEIVGEDQTSAPTETNDDAISNFVL